MGQRALVVVVGYTAPEIIEMGVLSGYFGRMGSEDQSRGVQTSEGCCSLVMLINVYIF